MLSRIIAAILVGIALLAWGISAVSGAHYLPCLLGVIAGVGWGTPLVIAFAIHMRR